MPQDQGKYTDPALRERLKAEIERGDKGGRPGQWSARKSQLLAREYERQGGGYHGGKDEAAQSLDRWTGEDWQTGEGSGTAEHGHHMSRYLPKKVWDALSAAERKEAEQSKLTADEQGEQHVNWPPAVKKAMQQLKAGEKGSAETRDALYRRAAQLNIPGRSRMNKAELQRAMERAG